jgi:hypothetical protein
VGLEGLGPLKNPITSSGIEPATLCSLIKFLTIKESLPPPVGTQLHVLTPELRTVKVYKTIQRHIP